MREFTIGGVLRRATMLLGAHAGLLIGAALLVVALPQTVGLAVLSSVASEHPALAGLGGLWYWVGGTLLQAIVLRVALDDVSRKRSSPGELAGTAARFFFPIVAIALLGGIATGLASFLLVIPGLMLLCRWYLTVPVEIAERSGIMASFGRSAHLTFGVRWKVFGLILILAVIGFALAFAGGFIGGLITRLSQNRWPSLVGQSVGAALFTLVGPLASTAAYLTLREIKEGSLSEDLLSVFE